MAGMETWQRPASDDINPDALEYLFAPTTERSASPPWVEIISQPEPTSRQRPELGRLQAKVEILAAEVDLLSNRLQSANCTIGCLQSQLEEREKLLQNLPELRSVASKATNSYKSSGSTLKFPMDLAIYLMMIGFAWAVLLTLLH